MSRLGHLIRTSLEEVTEVIEVNADEVIVQAEETPAEVEVELMEAAQEVEVTTDVVEELESAAATLESIALGIEEILESDAEAAIEPQAAEFIAEQVEEVTETLGLGEDADAELIASTESFATNRRVASMESLTKIKEFLVRIWNAIRTAVTNAVNAVINFFRELFSGVGALEKRSSELAAVIAKMDKAAVAEGKLNLRGAAQIAFDKTVSATKLRAGLEATAATGMAVFGNYAPNVVNHYAAAGEMAKVVAAKEAADLKGLTAKLSDSAAKAAAALDGKRLLGDARFAATSEANNADGASVTELAAALKLGAPVLVKQDAQLVAKVVTEVEILTGAALTDTLKAANAVIAQIKRGKDTVAGLDKAVTGFRKAADDAVKGSDNNAIQNYKNRLVLQAVMRAGGKPWARPMTQYSACAFGAVRKTLTYVERSVAAHKAPAAK